MNLDLKSDKLSYMRPVFRRRFTKEETIEVIVPDALPDILRILDTDGTPYLRSKDCEAGRVSVTGVSELTVLYVPETGGGVRKLNVTLPFSMSAEGSDITPDCLITASLSLTAADSRTVNPRKVVVRAEAACEAALYLPESLYNTAPREKENLYFQADTVSMLLSAAVNEKTFIFTDEAHLPDSAPAIGEILRATVSLSLESAKPVGSKAVLKGSARTDILYEAREGGRICRESVLSPFSQVVDTDASGDVTDIDTVLCVTGAYISRSLMDGSGTDALSVEVHAVAQCVPYVRMLAGMVTDAYSTRFELKPTMTQCELEGLEGQDTASETLTASIPVSGRPTEVLAVTPRLTSCAIQGGVYNASFAVEAIYQDPSGEVLSASRRGELAYELGQDGGQAEVSVHFGGEIFTALTDTSIDVRVPLELTVTRIKRLSFERMESVEVMEETPIDLSGLPTVVMTRFGHARGLWDLAKAHMSTVELIREANNLEPDAQPEEGKLLLIPRC